MPFFRVGDMKTLIKKNRKSSPWQVRALLLAPKCSNTVMSEWETNRHSSLTRTRLKGNKLHVLNVDIGKEDISEVTDLGPKPGDRSDFLNL